MYRRKSTKRFRQQTTNVGVGGSCTQNTECASGLSCSGTKCKTDIVAGGACSSGYPSGYNLGQFQAFSTDSIELKRNNWSNPLPSNCASSYKRLTRGMNLTNMS